MQKYQFHFRIAIPWYRFRVRKRFGGNAVAALKEAWAKRYPQALEAWSGVPDFRLEKATREVLNEGLIGCLQLRNRLFDLFLFEISDPHATLEVLCYPNVAERQAELNIMRTSDQILDLYDLVRQELARAGLAAMVQRIEANQQNVRAEIKSNAWRGGATVLALLAIDGLLGTGFQLSGLFQGRYGEWAVQGGSAVLGFFIGQTLTSSGAWLWHLLTGRRREVQYRVLE
jgi:hypothetical protein